MKKLLYPLGVLVMATAAHAADVKRSAVVANPWEGTYFGLNLGAGALHAEAPVLYGIRVTGVEGDGRGVLGGVQGGLNFSSGDLVLGVEADASVAKLSGDKTYYLTYQGNAITAKLTSSLKGFATVRARVGATLDRDTLLYATGGLAFGHFEQKINVSSVGSDSSSKLATGYALGVGIERSLGSGWSFKGEYLFAGFEKTYELSTVNNKLNIFRLGLNVKL